LCGACASAVNRAGRAPSITERDRCRSGFVVGYGAATHADEYAKVYAEKNGVPIEVAKVVVSWGATALLPVGPEAVSTVQGVSDLMNSVGVLPTNVQVAAKTDTSAFPAAGPSAPARRLRPVDSGPAAAS
jgi:hypothetical protein